MQVDVARRPGAARTGPQTARRHIGEVEPQRTGGPAHAPRGGQQQAARGDQPTRARDVPGPTVQTDGVDRDVAAPGLYVPGHVNVAPRGQRDIGIRPGGNAIPAARRREPAHGKPVRLGQQHDAHIVGHQSGDVVSPVHQPGQTPIVQKQEFRRLERPITLTHGRLAREVAEGHPPRDGQVGVQDDALGPRHGEVAQRHLSPDRPVEAGDERTRKGQVLTAPRHPVYRIEGQPARPANRGIGGQGDAATQGVVAADVSQCPERRPVGAHCPPTVQGQGFADVIKAGLARECQARPGIDHRATFGRATGAQAQRIVVGDAEHASLNRGQTRVGVVAAERECAQTGLDEMAPARGGPGQRVNVSYHPVVGALHRLVHGQGMPLLNINPAAARKRADGLVLAHDEPGGVVRRGAVQAHRAVVGQHIVVALKNELARGDAGLARVAVGAKQRDRARRGGGHEPLGGHRVRVSGLHPAGVLFKVGLAGEDGVDRAALKVKPAAAGHGQHPLCGARAPGADNPPAQQPHIGHGDVVDVKIQRGRARIGGVVPRDGENTLTHFQPGGNGQHIIGGQFQCAAAQRGAARVAIQAKERDGRLVA